MNSNLYEQFSPLVSDIVAKELGDTATITNLTLSIMASSVEAEFTVDTTQYEIDFQFDATKNDYLTNNQLVNLSTNPKNKAVVDGATEAKAASEATANSETKAASDSPQLIALTEMVKSLGARVDTLEKDAASMTSAKTGIPETKPGTPETESKTKKMFGANYARHI